MAASKRLTPEQRSLRSSIAAHSAHAKHGTAAMTAAMRHKANTERYELVVDPEGVLPPDERARRADQARRAHMKRLSYKAAKARREQQAAQVREGVE